MSGEVNPRRSYHSTTQQEQGARTAPRSSRQPTTCS